MNADGRGLILRGGQQGRAGPARKRDAVVEQDGAGPPKILQPYDAGGPSFIAAARPTRLMRLGDDRRWVRRGKIKP